MAQILRDYSVLLQSNFSLGILLATTAVDTRGCLFPLAHSVIDVENDDNWRSFLQQFLTVI